LENYFYVIPAQADGTNITVQATVEAAGTHVGEEMVIRVRNSIGSAITTPTAPTTPTEGMTELLIQLLPFIAIAIVAAIGGICVKKRR